MTRSWFGILLLWPLPLLGEIAVEGVEPRRSELVDNTSYLVVTGPVGTEHVPGVSLTGRLERQIWHVPRDGRTSYDVSSRLVAQAAALGLRPLYQCEGQGCGGFDFRRRAPITPPPDMFVNLIDFHYLALVDATEQLWVTLLVSRSGETIYVELVELAANAPPRPNLMGASALLTDKTDDAAEQSQEASPISAVLGVARALEREGHWAIPGLEFAAGQAVLTNQNPPSLAALGVYLQEDSTRRIAVVGHSDATGSYETNRDLSQRRAEHIRDILISEHAVPQNQIAAYGAGWVAPLATNLTPEGRARNRRVEVVLLGP